jgi:hypothetical protein
MRNLLRIVIVVIASALTDYCLSVASMAVSVLPPAHYAAWMTLLKGGCQSKLQFEVINAAAQWFGGPVVIGVTGFIVGSIARTFNTALSSVLAGLAAYAVFKIALGGVVDAPATFSLFFALVCSAGGYALADAVVIACRRKPMNT